ncbi:MAG: polymer-forming cytoskeletal protein [Spirochaetaceae bacterium]|nr:polymer-forming cytoskeletal protein [Spirochaetaceae bacterium]
MNKYFTKALLVVTALLLTTTVLSAQDRDVDFDGGSIQIVAVEGNRTTREGKTFNGDFFYGGKDIEYSGRADDIYLMSRRVNFSGNSTGSLWAFGNKVQISGVVEGNLHSAGNDFKIAGHIKETAFIGGDSILITPEAVIDGTLIVAGRTIEISGLLNNGLLGGGGEIIIDAPVTGNVTVNTGKLIITERGSISGNLTYDSKEEISDREKARVGGVVKFDILEDFDKGFDEDFGSFFVFIACSIVIATLLIAGLLILLLPGVKTLFSKSRDGKEIGKTLLWGLIPLFVYPLAVIVTIPLFPLSIALGLALFPLAALVTIMGLALSGKFLFSLFKWKNDNLLLQYLLAVGIYIVLSLIPFIGCLIGLAVTALGSGLLISRVFKADFS